MKKIVSVMLTVFLLLTALPLTAFAEDETAAPLVISENGSYTIDESHDSATPIDITAPKATVTLSNATVNGSGRSAIFVKDNADITFVLEGFNTVTGDENAFSCGIEVQYGSKVTFEGEGTLNVTGGKWGAAIGSYGTTINIPEEERVQVGEITINSGNINAYAGARGSGIGAGYHVNGNKITINGGIIHAYGKECGAGIGCGYGTSGGAIGVAAVGEYDSGTIIINGGEVYAATTTNVSFDYTDLAALNAQDPCSFAAGIGGGYGASASNIQINGGKVVAIGSCGGAGIGAGRGTSKTAQYNPNAYTSNVRIGGNADVTAIAATGRAKELNSGGAAIGSGRGSHTGGTVEITDNARVVAISATQAPAIGASKQKSPVDGAIPVAESIIIGDGVQLYAVSAGEYAVDKDAKSLSISPDYFGSSDRWFFEENAVAIADIGNVKAESPKGEKTYTVPVGSVSLWANIVPVKPVIPTTQLRIVTPLAMAVRFEDGSVYYSGDTVEVEYGKDYHFQMCCVDWSTRDANGEKKIHRPYEVFSPEHGTYSDEGLGLRGTVVYTVRVSDKYNERSYNAETKTFVLPKGDKVLRTDVNKCFMAYRFTFSSGDLNKQTGIDNVVYDTGKEHENTLEDFRYNKPLEYLSVNLPLGSTVTAKAYKNYEYIGQADVLVTIDEEHPDRCYKNYVWPY